MRRIKKKRKIKISTLQSKLWKLVSGYIKKKYGNTCYTCKRQNLTGRNWHTGHYIPSAICSFKLRYDERNLRPQCYNCNINLGGNGGRFGEVLRKEFGQGYLNDLWNFQFQKHLEKKPTVSNYLVLIEEYKNKLKLL